MSSKFLKLFAYENNTKPLTDVYLSIPKNYDHLRDLEITNVKCSNGLSNRLFIHFMNI